jgi:hypothetical protein
VRGWEDVPITESVEPGHDEDWMKAQTDMLDSNLYVGLDYEEA